MRFLVFACLIPTMIAISVLLFPTEAQAELEIIHEPDGTIRITNQWQTRRPRARITVEDGVMDVRLGLAPRVNPQMDRGQYDRAFESAAKQYELPVNLLKAVARVESAFDPHAISPVGAQGLMQLMPETGNAMGVRDFFDPWESIHGGARYLRKMLDRFEELELALAAYNAGPSAVERYEGIPPFDETQRYVRRVLDLLEGVDLGISLPQT